MTDVALFELEGVRVDLGGSAPALDDVTVSIPDCGIAVLAGPSGSGKSTLLRLCNRLEVPTAGTVRFRGDDVAALDPLRHRRRVGMVFQRPAPFPGTVADNLRVACGGAGDGLFIDALERAGLDRSFLGRNADDLSGGEAQRMCLARTLVTEPDVLLMDEPTSALDPPTALALERRARLLVDAGASMVWVTHDLAQVDRIADHVTVLVSGRVATDHERRHFLRGERHDHVHDDGNGGGGGG